MLPPNKLASLCLAVILAVASLLAYAPASEAGTAFKAVAPPAPDRTADLKLPDGGVLRLRSVRFTPAAGLSEAGNTVWCGIEIEQPGQPAQDLVTIGQGFSEALSCDGLAEAGTIESAGAIPRIGLLYHARSPNAASLIPVVIARSGPGSTWVVDEATSEKLGNVPGEPSLAWMRHALLRH